MRDDDPDDDEDEDDLEHLVARRPNPLPAREEELAEADILEELELEDTHRIERA